MRWTSTQDVENWLRRCERGKSDGIIRFRGEFFRPYHFVMAALYARACPDVEIDIPEVARNYAARIHFWDGAGRACPVAVQEYDRRETLSELAQIRGEPDINSVSSAFQNIYEAHYADASKDFGVVVSELLDNCYRHSETESDLYGLTCIQVWPNANKAQLCIADMGIGIRSALSKASELIERLTQENACSLAAEYGVTSKKGQGHSGYGLALSKGVCELNGGNMLIVSGNEYFRQCSEGETEGRMNTLWPGTLIIFEWNLDRPLETGPVYDQWPKEEEYDLDELF